jgi:hypothetical protein
VTIREQLEHLRDARVELVVVGGQAGVLRQARSAWLGFTQELGLVPFLLLGARVEELHGL